MSEQNNIDLLNDVPMKVTVELGRTRLTIEQILHLGEGSIIELDRLSGEAVDLLVNGKCIAKGEVVIIDEYFGIRITDISADVKKEKEDDNTEDNEVGVDHLPKGNFAKEINKIMKEEKKREKKKTQKKK